jgi:SAM-dependent methyltransferase
MASPEEKKSAIVGRLNQCSAEARRQDAGWPEWYCPIHHQPLIDNGDALLCTRHCYYLRENGIPRFVNHSSYSASFGMQWKRYQRTQLDSYTRLPLSRERLQRCLGDALWKGLSGTQVLEAGCGAGRFTEILLERGANVTSIDLSEAVEANQENFPQGERHRIAQANILLPPFAPRQFDLVVCLGVIQHTPDPEETIATLFEQVKPNGWLVFDHYTYGISYFTKTFPLFRLFLRRLPAEEGMKKTEWLVNTLWPLHQRARNSCLANILLSRLSPVLDYYRVHPELNEEVQKEWALLDTHDLLTDWYKHLRTKGAILRTLGNLGLRDIWCEYGGNGVEARGKRSGSAIK